VLRARPAVRTVFWEIYFFPQEQIDIENTDLVNLLGHSVDNHILGNDIAAISIPTERVPKSPKCNFKTCCYVRKPR